MIAVTAATGHLGQLVVEELLKRKINPKDIVAVVRNKSKASALAAQGIVVREADYNDAPALEKALQGVDKVLLISGMDLGKRAEQHQNVIHAAKKNKVGFIAYTSILRAESSKMFLATEHLATEKAIRASGLAFSFLRNGWYIENYFGNLNATLENGIAGSGKNGRISGATRADFAAAAAEVLTHTPAGNSIFELGGQAFTLSELAQEMAEVSQRKVAYHDMPAQDYEKLLLSFGLPAPVANMLADSDLGIERGDLFTDSHDLEKLLGRKPTTLKAAVKKALS